jgi:hypothetical protein
MLVLFGHHLMMGATCLFVHVDSVLTQGTPASIGGQGEAPGSFFGLFRQKKARLAEAKTA